MPESSLANFIEEFTLSLKDIMQMVLLSYHSYITLSIYISCLFEVDHSTVSRISATLEPLLAKGIPLPQERFLSQEDVMCFADATEQSIERLRRNQHTYSSLKI